MYLLMAVALAAFVLKDHIPAGLNQHFEFLRENPRYLVVAFFVFNFISGQLIATGAFEVYYKGELLWSKLENGRLPTHQAIFDMLMARGAEMRPPPSTPNIR
eukprot:gnl/Hemi2/6742_TR2296_c0_g1_i1.p2 gnl/Hemi2/6742_TR2296_c0_g1~~gnl/Hemi2/6742_TR2296_c0_g1_i1.p2  ORF type:complete len:102 (+),score=35.41 gnl/Hemi2/6742_TR2296_c0_g1_i1:238-543(+)